MLAGQNHQQRSTGDDQDGKLSDDVRNRRWKFIVHIMRKGFDNDCRTAMAQAPEGYRWQGRPRTTWRRTAEKERERAGWRSWSEVSTANRVSRPYAPFGMK